MWKVVTSGQMIPQQLKRVGSCESLQRSVNTNGNAREILLADISPEWCKETAS